MGIRLVLAPALVLLGLTFCASLAYAQEGVPNVENSVRITLSPQYPQAGERVHLSAGSSIIDLPHSDIVWYANGKVIASGRGVTSADVTVGALGKETTIEVDVTAGKVTATGTAVIIPSEVDLLLESDSYTPPFYRGRALPSAGTSIRLQAIARFVRSGGTLVPQNQITFTWKRNGQVVGNVSGQGKSSAALPAPSLFGTDSISVEAVSADGTFSGATSIRIPSTEPILTVYEDHPLFGLLYHSALGTQTFIPETEMTFVAVPYFAQATSPNDPRLEYAWRVNGKAIPADSTKPSEVTINSNNTPGTALLSLELTHVSNFFMDSSGSWSISFSGQAASPSGADVFHTTGQ